MNDDERDRIREELRSGTLLMDHNSEELTDLGLFVADLDERIERLRNPLTPESKGE